MIDVKKTNPADINDKALADVQGGADLKIAMATKFDTPMVTVDAVAIEEDLMVLRKRPGRMKYDTMDSVEEAGVLRRRPTR